MTKELGNLGEKLAAQRIKQMGYRIITENFSCPIGEIDLIAKDRETLVFIEVRTRKSSKYGFPFETVNFRKQQKIKKVAQYYLVTKKIRNMNCRFDVISIIWAKEKAPQIDVIQDAF